jgi:MFS family permease
MLYPTMWKRFGTRVRNLMGIPPINRGERLSFRASFLGEMGRGLFDSVAVDFTLIVAVSYFFVQDRRLLWMISSASAIGMMFAMFATTMTVRRRKKTIAFACEAVSRVALLFAAFVSTGWVFVTVAALSIAMNGMAVPLVNSIYGTNFRQSVRGPLVGWLQSAAVGTATLVGMLVSWIMDLDVGYYRYILVASSSISFILSWRAWHLPELVPKHVDGAIRHMFKDVLLVLFRDPAFLWVEVYWFIIGFSNLWLDPLRVLHLREIGLSEGQILFALITIIKGVQVLTLSFWGWFLYNVNFAIYRMINSVLTIVAIYFTFHSRTYLGVCFGATMFGLAYSGSGLSWRLVATLFTTGERVAVYMTMHCFLFGVRGIVGPWLSLQLRETRGAVYVANLSMIGMALSILLLVPFIPVIARRRRQINEWENGGGKNA